MIPQLNNVMEGPIQKEAHYYGTLEPEEGNI